MHELLFHSLVIETNDRCNARCAMCYQAAGPRGSDLRGDGHLPLDVGLRVIGEAAVLPELIGKRCHLSGGEGFLYFDDMLTLFRHASSLGFTEVGATTNAFWALSRQRALQRCEVLADAGVNYLEVSMDFWHLPYVKVDRIRDLIWAMRRTGLRPVLRLLSSKSHHMDEIMREFTAAELIHVQIANSRVQPSGRASTEVPIEDVYMAGGVEGACERMLNLTISPNGNVYPCCAGADMTKEMASGNVLTDSLADAVLKMRTDHMIRTVIHKGAGELIKVAQGLGYGDRVDKQYSSICHLCWDVFQDEELATAVRNHYNEEHFGILLESMTGNQQAAS
jgi:MoaA/NifB/PqqE/SkfB family radical SAM enzyme